MYDLLRAARLLLALAKADLVPKGAQQAVDAHHKAYERANAGPLDPDRAGALQALIDRARARSGPSQEPAPAGPAPIKRPKALWSNPDFGPTRCYMCIAGGRASCPHYG